MALHATLIHYPGGACVEVVDTRTGARVEVRGHARPGVAYTGDRLDRLLDSLSPPTVSQLHAGDTVVPWSGSARSGADARTLAAVLHAT